MRPDDGRSKRAGRPLSATTVLAIESGESRFPRDTTKDALVNGFAAYGVDITVEALEDAWRKVAPKAVRTWIAEYEADLPAATPAAPVHEYADPVVPSADDVVKNLGGQSGRLLVPAACNPAKSRTRRCFARQQQRRITFVCMYGKTGIRSSGQRARTCSGGVPGRKPRPPTVTSVSRHQ